MTALLARIYREIPGQDATRPLEFLRARRISSTVGGSGIVAPFPEYKLDRSLYLQTLSVTVSISTDANAARLVYIGIEGIEAVAAVPWPDNRPTFAARGFEQVASSGQLVSDQASSSPTWNVPPSAQTQGVFNFRELMGLVIPPGLLLGVHVNWRSSGSPGVTVYVHVTGWLLPPGNLVL